MSISPWEVIALVMVFVGDVLVVIAVVSAGLILAGKLMQNELGHRLARAVRLWETAVATIFFGVVGLFGAYMAPQIAASRTLLFQFTIPTIAVLLAVAGAMLAIAWLLPADGNTGQSRSVND